MIHDRVLLNLCSELSLFLYRNFSVIKRKLMYLLCFLHMKIELFLLKIDFIYCKIYLLSSEIV